jgi:plasmid maintenance system killer protein
VRRAFFKQVAFLEKNRLHPSLHAKKFDEALGLWQARVNRNWRFYFTIVEDEYRLHDLKPHPK